MISEFCFNLVNKTVKTVKDRSVACWKANMKLDKFASCQMAMVLHVTMKVLPKKKT